MLNDEYKVIAKNTGKNVINLDSESESSCSSSDLEEMRMNLVKEILAAQQNA